MQKVDPKTLDAIMKLTVNAVEKGKNQVYDIYEVARTEMEGLTNEFNTIKQQTAETIYLVDELERREQRARLRLMEVSRSFRTYSEQDVRDAYEDASRMQVELAVLREKEKTLRRKRDELEMRFKGLRETHDKAEGLVSQIGAALGMLGQQVGDMVSQIENLQQWQFFGVKIIKAQEEERRRVAREIHDGPAQAMANVVFRAEVCERLIDTDVQRSKRELQELREQVRQTLKEVRKIIFDLRPMALDDLGIVPTVRRVLDTIKERGSCATELKVHGEERRLESYVEIGVFRTIQEALNNIEKHARARKVSITLTFGSDAVGASIEDDGCGFDMAVGAKESSFGLMGMRERMNILGGEIKISSAPGKGTKVAIKVPLK